MDKKAKPELVTFICCSALSVVGTVLTLTALLMPYWYEVKFVRGQVLYKVNVGLWQDRLCVGDDDCENKWIEDYDRLDEVTMPSGHLIKWFETVGSALALLTVVNLTFLWITRKSRMTVKYVAHVLFFTPCLLAGFAIVTGTLVLASKGDDSKTDWASFVAGGGGALLFLAACMSCVLCRFDPTYGTLENPVSPKYIVTS